ncbi:MAG: pantetheine-phosphate adenylyltransferase [Actinomycetota bacterium]|jgi:pantetheine-phosphate adenylyltransferase
MRQRSSAANLEPVKTIAIYPGSFDPVTLGHLSVLNRAAGLFSEIHVVVVHNPNKKATFSLTERVELFRGSVELPGVKFSALEDGLLVEYAKSLGACAIVKGFRTAADIEYELPMAQVNRDLSGLETVFIPAEPGFGYVSSSLVKEVAGLGGDVSGYLTKDVARALIERLGK